MIRLLDGRRNALALRRIGEQQWGEVLQRRLASKAGRFYCEPLSDRRVSSAQVLSRLLAMTPLQLARLDSLTQVDLHEDPLGAETWFLRHLGLAGGE